MSAPRATTYGPESFAQDLAVSRETLTRFEAYEAILRRWQPSINLIGRDTVSDLWRRHFLDCAQLLRYLPNDYGALYDIGSGAGFPGLVLAILGAHDVFLIEADQRKCAFLREAARVTGAGVTVLPQRVEALEPPPAGWPRRRVLVARAVAPLDRLLQSARGLIDSETRCVMLKSMNVEAEIAAAYKIWGMRVETAPSLSDPRGVILMLSDLVHV